MGYGPEPGIERDIFNITIVTCEWGTPDRSQALYSSLVGCLKFPCMPAD